LRESRSVAQTRWDETWADLKTSRAEVRRLQAALALSRERLKDTLIHAPFDGVVSECRVDPGDFVVAGEILVTLFKLSEMEAVITVPDRHMGRIRKGQPAEVMVDAYPDHRISGRVTFVSPNVEELTRDFLVKAEVSNEENVLKPGAFAVASITVAVRENVPTVPERALVATREGYEVFVVQDGIARQRKVRIGQRQVGRAEVVEGLRTGEVVVTAGHLQLSDGNRVSVVSEGALDFDSARQKETSTIKSD